MWISKRRFKAMEKRIADLEGQVQGQQDISVDLVANKINHQLQELHKEQSKAVVY